MNDFKNISDFSLNMLIPWGLKLFNVILILTIGLFIKKLLVKIVRKLLERAKLEQIIINFVATITNAAIMIFIIISCISELGIETTSIITILGAAGLAIGLALQGSLQNFAAGIMLIIFRPFKTGDFVEAAGVSGNIEKISIFHTIMRTVDNREVIVPNSQIYSSTITNFSARDTRRIDLLISISYKDDIQKTKDILKNIIDNDNRILKEPEVVIGVLELADNSINIALRPWVKTEEFWEIRSDLLEKIKNEFDRNEINIPFPQMEVHLVNDKKRKL